MLHTAALSIATLGRYNCKYRETTLTLDVEIHGLADIGSDVIADSTQVEAAVFLQHMLNEQRAVDQHLDPKA